MSMTAENDAAGDSGPKIMQVLMHDVLREDFQAWLTARGLELQRVPFLDESPDLPVYNVAPGLDLIIGRARPIPPAKGTP